MWYNARSMKTGRARVLAELNSYPGEQLVLVRYSSHPTARYEWVYNEADVNRAKVVWARDMGESQNRELIGYYKNRHIWLAEPDNEGTELSLYSVK